MGNNIKAELTQIADESNRGCGLVYELYLSRFTAGVESYLLSIEPSKKSEVIKEAKKFGYDNHDPLAEETQQDKELVKWSEENGFQNCIHGLDPDCCPRGCGEV